jgi:hypothetical protein
MVKGNYFETDPLPDMPELPRGMGTRSTRNATWVSCWITPRDIRPGHRFLYHLIFSMSLAFVIALTLLAAFRFFKSLVAVSKKYLYKYF